MINKTHFGKRIAIHRRQLDMSQAELAERLGVTSQAVSKWETGTALPDIDLLLELSHMYGDSVNELLEDRDMLKPLADREYRMEDIALFDSCAEVYPSWAEEMVRENWFARNWADAKSPYRRVEREAGQRISEAGGIILELGVGPGGGFVPYILQADPGASIIISDLSPTVVREWKKLLDRELDSPNLSYAAFDYCHIPFRDCCIDVVSDRGGIANVINAKGELGDKGAALKEAYRVLKPGGMLVTDSGFVTEETLAQLPEHAQKVFLKERPDIFQDLYAQTVLAGFQEIDSVCCGHWYTDDDDSGVADLARSLGVNLKFTGFMRYCRKCADSE